MDPILEIARTRGLAVIEDAHQAHGAECKGRRAGSLRRRGMLQFLPHHESRGLEAGIMLTRRAEWAQRARGARGWTDTARSSRSGLPGGPLPATRASRLRGL
jgi:dTDP-4-amino-4,6-dideoxygalactose transaminase